MISIGECSFPFYIMLFLLVTGISFILFIKSISFKPLLPWTCDMRLLPRCFWKEFSSLISTIIKKSLSGSFVWFPPTLSIEQRTFSSRDENVEETEQISVLDLPELALECILERLSPAGLCNMAGVCCSLRARCTSDHLWERHVKQKWGRVLGPVAYREWQWFIASKKDLFSSEGFRPRWWIRFMCRTWPFAWFRSKFGDPNKQKSSLPVESIMSWYVALETGRFWFPAQVYNRENGHVGFLMSCYDAELSYDLQTDTFRARYPPHGRRLMAIESGVQWERIRAPPVDTSPYDLHISDCLNDLCPGDHIEIQWRRNKEFPYGWWYGIVGHLESCDGNQLYCRCRSSDTVVLKFHQYAPGSRWGTSDHKQEGAQRRGKRGRWILWRH
ncbi:hypothetical protein Ancab_000206 [Ancistrocladus abbreviatus]